MKALFDSVVRTVTPIVVGAVLGWVASINISPDPEFQGALTVVITGAFQALWYIGVRLFEEYISPKFGWLLGIAAKPEYPVKDSTS